MSSGHFERRTLPTTYIPLVHYRWASAVFSSQYHQYLMTNDTTTHKDMVKKTYSAKCKQCLLYDDIIICPTAMA